MEDWKKVAWDYIIEYGPKLLLAIVVLFIGSRLIKMAMKGFRMTLNKRNLDESLKKFLISLVGWILKILLFVAVLEMIGVKTTSFIAIIGAAGLAIGLALQGTLANFAGGVLIMLFKPYRVGDVIESGGVMGKVKDIQIFNTIILTRGSKTAILPNGAVMNNHIINYAQEGILRVDMLVGISYNANIKEAREVLIKVMLNHELVLKEPAPQVTVLELGDNSVNLAVRPHCLSDDYWKVYFEVLEECKIKLDEAKISIPFPQRDVHIFNH